MPAALDHAAIERVRTELEEIEGVQRVVIDDGEPPQVFIIADRSTTGPTEMVVHSVLARHGLAPNAQVQLSYLSSPEPRRRVRFVSAKIEKGMQAAAEVELEWAGQLYRATLHGESGYGMELRVVALATLQALDEVLGGRVTIQLVGIKPFRAFDADVVVALLKSDVDGRSLIGAALASDDPYRAASVAVLNATNRILGNYLNNDELADSGS